jgi:alkylation response protein AidB-like acyl-CoA dehydrogenase
VRTGEAGPKGISCIVVEKGTPGLSFGKHERKMGWNSQPTAQVIFEDCRVPVANRIGAEGDGFTIAVKTFERSRPGIAAQAVGIAQGALEVATAYAKDRRQFGKRIGDFQMVGAMLADMDAATEAARQLLYKACVEIEAGSPDAARWAAMCKLVAGDTAMRVTTDAVQVLGGYGYIDEFPVERMMRDAKITQLYEGTQQIQRSVIARALLGKGS